MVLGFVFTPFWGVVLGVAGTLIVTIVGQLFSGKQARERLAAEEKARQEERAHADKTHFLDQRRELYAQIHAVGPRLLRIVSEFNHPDPYEDPDRARDALDELLSTMYSLRAQAEMLSPRAVADRVDALLGAIIELSMVQLSSGTGRPNFEATLTDVNKQMETFVVAARRDLRIDGI